MAKPKRLNDNHHWVSQFVLRNFAISGNPGKIYVYERNKKPFDPMINTVAQLKGFNTLTSRDRRVKTDKLEKMFGDVENQAAPIVARLNKTGQISLSDEERKILSLYIGLLISATPWSRRMQRRLLEEQRDSFLLSLEKNRDELINGFKAFRPDILDAAERIKRFLDNPNSLIDEIRHTSKTTFALTSWYVAFDLAKILNERSWKLGVLASPHFFIISDNPVCSIPPPDSPYKWNDGFIGYPILLPIAPDKCLYIVKDDISDRTYHLRPEAADLFNNYTLFFAQERVFSHRLSDDIRKRFDKTLGNSDEIILNYEIGTTNGA